MDDNRAVDDQGTNIVPYWIKSTVDCSCVILNSACFPLPGWEYGVTIPPDDKPRSWVPAEKVYHVHRRRRLVRPRKRAAAGGAAVEVRAKQLNSEARVHKDLCQNIVGFYHTTFVLHTQRHDRGDPEGWEFSSLIGWKFHRMERSADTFRRRRWRRKMAPEDRLGASAIFQLEGALVSEWRKTGIFPF